MIIVIVIIIIIDCSVDDCYITFRMNLAIELGCM